MKTLTKYIYFPFAALALVCFGLSPTARAATPDILPTPDGCYPGFNTAEGCQALLNINTALGLGNTAIGQSALKFLTSGDNNTAVGVNTLLFTTTAIQNTALGQGALQNNNGDWNTATGFQALFSNTTADGNTASGYQALVSNTTGGTFVADDATTEIIDALGPNTAMGMQALLENTTGSSNNAVGFAALFSNTTGKQNNAFGNQALSSNVMGNFNTAIGDFAGSAITGNWNIDIGKDVVGVAAENFVTRIGISDHADPLRQKKCFIGGINDVTLTPPYRFVVINSLGQLGAVNLDSVASAELINKFETAIAQQQKEIKDLTAQLKEQAAQIQKVSAQLEVSKPAPQIVKNP